MASSTSTTSGGDERPRAPHADASAAAGTAPLTLPQAHVEWAASMQAYYAAGGQPYAWHAAQVRATDRPTDGASSSLFFRVVRVRALAFGRWSGI
jgi:plant G-box-binding factor